MQTEIQKIIYPEANEYPNLTDEELIVKLLDELVMSLYFNPSNLRYDPPPLRVKQALQLIAHSIKNGKNIPLTAWLGDYMRDYGFLNK